MPPTCAVESGATCQTTQTIKQIQIQINQISHPQLQTLSILAEELYSEQPFYKIITSLSQFQDTYQTTIIIIIIIMN